MNGGISKFKNVIAWPEFRLVWILLALVAGAFALTVMFLTPPFSWIEEGLLIIVAAMTTAITYYAAKTDRDTNVERNELRSMLASIEDALIVYEQDFRVIFFNPAAERLFKIHSKEVIGHVFNPRDVEKEGWRILIQTVFPSLAPRVMLRTKEGEFPQVADLSFTDPQQLEFRVTTAPVADDRGRPLAFMKIIRDRTSQIAALRSRSEFVTVASHQLRSPVTDINWALQALAQATELNDTNKVIAATALQVSKGLLRRIEDLLNIAKMEEGQFGYNFVDADIVEFVGKILADVLPSARATGVKIYFDRPQESLPHVMIAPDRLSIAMANIIENAIRYNVENGEVTVKVDKMPEKPFVVVSIKDTGIGVPPDAMEKLFTKFYRAENAMRTQTDGSGLGLYLAKAIIMAHGGQIWAESELNRGTTISFALPTDPNLIPKHEINTQDFF